MDSLFKGVQGGLLSWVQTNSLTSDRHGDGLEYIRIWTIPPRRLVFWDGAQSPYKMFLST